MMLIRIQLINSAPAYFIKSLILSLRYVLERKTTDSSNFYSKFNSDGSLASLSSVALHDSIPRPVREYHVIDYQATKQILIPAWAFAWVSRFTSYKCFEMYDQMNENIKNGDFSLMKDLHSLACAIKAYYMDEIINQLKWVRECMGGHGYLSASAVTELIEMASPNSTLEGNFIFLKSIGDIAVMYQQTARDIFKSVGRVMSGKTITGTFAYINDLPNIIGSQFEKESITELSDFIEILKATALLQIVRVGNELRKDESISFDTKWNKLYLHEIIKTSKLHSIYTSAVNWFEGLKQKKMSDKLRQAMLLLWKIYASENIVKFCDQALLDGYINAKQLLGVQEQFLELVEQFRPFLAVMTEPLSVCEGSIDGILSQKDGKTYERIYTESSRSALNSKTVIDSVSDHVKPLSKLLQSFYQPTAKI